MNFTEFFSDPTFAINSKGVVIAWNKAVAEMTGVGAEDMLGKGDYAYSIPFYGRRRPMLIDLVFTLGAQKPEHYNSFEWRGDTLTAESRVSNLAGGKGVYVWGTASPLRDSAGNTIGAIETIRDITDARKRRLPCSRMECGFLTDVSLLEKINTSLDVLLEARKADKLDLDRRIGSNMRVMVLPYLDKLKKSRLDQNQRKYVGILESALKEVLSPFLATLKYNFENLTPAEIQVANFIRNGKTSKEIADILHVVEKTVEIHRYNIRVKLGLKKKRVNLRSFLLSLK